MDEWDEKAEALFPCSHNCQTVGSARFHDARLCGVNYRPTVAAELRATYLKGLEDAEEISREKQREHSSLGMEWARRGDYGLNAKHHEAARTFGQLADMLQSRIDAAKAQTK